jgi:threonine/homoserine/homoserine lactone efflux protein
MPTSDILLAFLLAAGIFAYMPGPALLYAAAQTIARGRKAGFLAALGLHVGGYVHVIAAAFGLAIVFKLVPSLYLILKFVGASYLVWLGLRMIFQKPQLVSTHEATITKTPRRVFWESVSVEVLNPKTALFFLAFLPQFTDPGAAFPIWLQLLILGTVVNIMFSSADIVCVMLSDRISTLMKASAKASRWTARLGGSILVALGLNIVLRRG